MLVAFINSVKELKELYQRDESLKLKILSEKLIHESALNSDKLKAKIACIAYVLYKHLSKEHLTSNARYLFFKNRILAGIVRLIGVLEQHNFHEAWAQVNDLIHILNQVDHELGHYSELTFDKAQTKLASSAYALGLSLQQASYLTDASTKQTFNCVGVTRMHDEIPETNTIADRLQLLKKVLE